MTRFSATALAEGWLNVTLCWLPTSKLFQSMAARWDDWSIRVLPPVWLIAAAPPTTMPPAGRAFGAGCAAAGSASTSRTVVCKAVVISRAERQYAYAACLRTLSARASRMRRRKAA